MKPSALALSTPNDGPPPVARNRMSTESSISLVASNLLLSGLFALMMWNAIPRKALFTWLAVAAVLGFVELFLRVISTKRRINNTGSASTELIAVLDVCIGFQWLYAAIFFFPVSQSNLQFFCLFSLAAPALCTVVYQHADLPTCFARLGLALPVGAYHLLIGTGPLGEVQALIVLGLWASLIWLAVRLHRSLCNREMLFNYRDALLQKVADNTRDLDAMRTMEASFRELAESANRAKSRFLAHSSHDLRQPLHAISLLLETIDDDQLDESNGHVVVRVRQSVELLAKLFDSLLDLTLLDTGQVAINNVPFNLSGVLTGVVGDLDAVAEANNVSVTLESCDMSIIGDPTVTRRMIQNLVANAIRHAPRGAVVLRGREIDGSVFLEVEDTGSGIAVEDQRRIFEEFTRLGSTADKQSQGSLGLGLAIVNRLARLCGVQVSVESEPGRGSLFSIGPFERCASIDGPATTNSTPVADMRRHRVVVVDDDRDTLKATGKLLSKWGLKVTLLEEGNVDAMPAADIVVCDYELASAETGIDVIKNVRAKYGDHVPALLISGNTSPDLAAKAASEDLRLLHKPVRPAQLKSALLTLLGTVEQKSAESSSASEG